MTICGYNDKIGEGLRILFEGMIQALHEKAVKSSAEAVMDNEIIELEAMINTLSRAKGKTLPEMFVGLNLLAKPLFERVRANLKSSVNGDLGMECREVGEAFVALLADAERKSIRQRLKLGSNIEPEELASDLAQWVLKECEKREKRETVLT
jgi:hypothetical protein